jgi:capsular exopolysaccharide synthesis family protein
MAHDLLRVGPPSSPGIAAANELRPAVSASPSHIPDVEPADVIRRYLSALLRYKWLILAILTVGTVVSFAATRMLRPVYESQATLWIASQTPQGRTVGPFRAEELVNSNAWPDLLTSYSILDSVVLKVRLYVHPAAASDKGLFDRFALAEKFRPGAYRLAMTASTRTYTLTTSEGQTVERGTMGDSVGRVLGFRWAPAPALPEDHTVKFTVVTPRAASLELRDQITAILPPNANLLRIRLQGSEPVMLTTTTNTLLQQFVATASTLKSRNLVELARTLDQQLAYAQAQLHEAEIALENFRVNTITLPSEGGPVASGVQLTRDPVMTSYFAQKIEYDNIVHDRELLEQMLGELHSGTVDVSSLWFVNAVQNGPPELRTALSEYAVKAAELRAARQVFTDEHRSVKEKDAALRQLRDQTIPQLGLAMVTQLREREQALTSRISSAGRELRQIPTRTIEEMRLTRNVAVRENLYTTLKNRYEEARLASASAIPDVSILDSAVAPQAPSSNRAPRVVALGVLGTLGVAVLLALALDRFDHRFRYPDQITRDLRLDILGVVPVMERGIRNPQRAAEIIESFRSIRLGLAQAFQETGVPMVTVTSPGPGDGKSIVCANLALSFASGGFRTLLVDGDIRRGGLHTTMGIDGARGLTDVLFGACTTTQAVRATDTQNLWILPCGSRRPGAPELLTSQRLLHLVTDLRTQFDVLIVDSAPLGAGIDGFALAAATRNLLLVMRAGQTDRKLAEAKLRIVDRLPINLLGAVVNGTRTEGMYQHYAYPSGYADVTDGTAEDIPSRDKQISVV